jgi:cyclopropane-fatty-acyl-phospholipid synthase
MAMNEVQATVDAAGESTTATGGSPAPDRRPVRGPASSSRSRPLERVVLRRLLLRAGLTDLTVHLPDGEKVTAGSEPTQYAMSFQSRAALWRVIRDREHGFLEGFVDGSIEVSGDLIDFLNMVKRHHSLTPERPISLRARLQDFFRRRKGRRSKANVVHHYDLGNEFYRLWLDEQLVYTCAYFERPEMTLEEAQSAKLDHVCRKLRIRPGETVIEAGCGWGALALHMARHYGARVRAFNLSDEQVDFARARAKREQLERCVEFVKEDWRQISGQCDAFVSVGMLEHVGPENYRQLGTIVRQVLGGEGRGLIHTIGQNVVEPLSPWIEKNIFPGAQPPTLRQMMDLFSPYDLSILDVENLRPHYALTCRHWLERFDRHTSKVRAMFDERFVRAWRMYLASSASAFEIGSLQLYQVLFTPIGSGFFPMSRLDVYQR